MPMKKSNEIRNQSIFENAIDVCFNWEYRNGYTKPDEKWLFYQNRNEFVRKMKLKFPKITPAEIYNFMKIYLSRNSYNDSDWFLKEKKIWIMSLGYCGPYLREQGDPEYP